MIEWLTGTLLATTVLMAAVLVAREPVRKAFGPAAAYGLWLIPALRMLMPPLKETVERIVPAAPVASAVRSVTVESAPVALPVDWATIGLWVWLAGAAIMLAAGVLVYRWQRREVLRDAVQLARLDGIRVVSSPAVNGPMAFGLVDRIVAVPMDFKQRFDARERRLAFEHELAHHRSGDLIVSHLGLTLLCLQWFNPLAWLSHAAFRFDQEAACDARVLGKAGADNRAAYAQAIAKAASGRALLFAGALDRPRTLNRRLESMLTSASNRRRLAGKTLIVVTAVAALPLSASRAKEYVDVQAPAAPAAVSAPVAVTAPVAAVAAVAATSPAAPGAGTPKSADGTYTLSGGVKLDRGSTAFFDDDTVLINGERKRLDQLTPAERSKMRTTILKSQAELAKERAELPGRLAEAQQELARIRSGAFKAELLRDRDDLKRDLAEIDSEAAELRAAGEDPEKRKAELLADLREIDATDIGKQVSEALEEANPAKITAELQSAEQQMTRLIARLDQLDRR